jgi:hypothetical protein
LLIYGAQFETGVMTDYIATTTTAVSVGPVSGLPRLDYLNSTCPRLLLEPQRTNVVTYSEQFNNPDWSSANITVTANAIASPDGTTNADKLESTTTVNSYVNQSTSNVGAYTHSVYAKAGNVSSFTILWASYNGGKAATFNLSNGTATAVGATVSATITNVGNGWYRCTTTDTSANYIVLISLNNDTNTAISIGSYIYLWGAQAESGAYATSYIPTLGTSVTRVADDASKTGISSLIGQTEGTIFFDGVISGVQNSSTNIINSEKNTTCSFYMQRVTSSSQISAGFIFSGTTTAVVSGGTVAIGQRVKIAWAYKSGSNALYINGTLINSNTTTFTPPSTFDDLFLNDDTTYFGYQEGVQFNQTLLFKTRLTNAQLAELTTI